MGAIYVAKEIVTIPDLGGAESVEVIELCVAVGDSVEPEESPEVLESDKASMDVPSPVQGAVVKFLVAEGDTVKVGDAIAEIESAGAQSSTEETVTDEPAPQAQPDPAPEPAVVEQSAPQAAESSEQTALVPRHR